MLHRKDAWRVSDAFEKYLIIENFNIRDADLEAVLILSGAIIPPQRQPPSERLTDDHEGDEDMSDDESVSQMRSTSTNGPRRRNIRGNANTQEDDEDFDFDM